MEGASAKVRTHVPLCYISLHDLTISASLGVVFVFSLARGHALSPHNPTCRECGLVLCTLNLPQYACPHCSSALFTPAARAALIVRLEGEIAERLVREAEERERRAEEARVAVGAFPSLPAKHPNSSATAAVALGGTAEQPRKVLSLDAKTKRVMVSSYSRTSPGPSRPASPAEVVEQEPDRLPPPPPEVVTVGHVNAKLDPARPWMNLAFPGLCYVSAG